MKFLWVQAAENDTLVDVEPPKSLPKSPRRSRSAGDDGSTDINDARKSIAQYFPDKEGFSVTPTDDRRSLFITLRKDPDFQKRNLSPENLVRVIVREGVAYLFDGEAGWSTVGAKANSLSGREMTAWLKERWAAANKDLYEFLRENGKKLRRWLISASGLDPDATERDQYRESSYRTGEVYAEEFDLAVLPLVAAIEVNNRDPNNKKITDSQKTALLKELGKQEFTWDELVDLCRDAGYLEAISKDMR